MDECIKDLSELKKSIELIENFKFKIKVVANSKNNSIEFCDEFIKVKIKERAIEGKANKAIIKYLSEILDMPKSKILISHGEKSSLKTIKIEK